MHARARPRSQLTERVFRPPRAVGVIIGGAFAVWALVFAALLANLARVSEAELKTFLAWAGAAVFAALALLFANWAYSVLTLAYTVSQRALTITWGFRRVIIPIENVQRMLPGRTLDQPNVQGLNWWGCHVGSANVKRLGYTLFYSTHNVPEELLYVVTSQESYGLTVIDQAAFAEEIQARAGLAPVGQGVQRSVATGIAALPFWRDRVATWAFALSLVACAVLVGYVFDRYASLPPVVRLDFPALGGILRVGDKGELLHIAYLGAGVLAVNTVLGLAVHARERAAGLWLLGSAGMIQAVLFAAAVIAIRHA